MDPDFQAKADLLVSASNGAIWIESGDRDTETQTRLWDEAVAKYGPDEARNWVAPPGHSNHEKGVAIDFGGDMNLLAQLAPQYGLTQPMSWEPWHWEPLGTRESASPQAYTPRPINPSALVRSTKTRDYGDVMSTLLNIKSFSPGGAQSADISLTRGGTDPIIASNPGFLSQPLMDILGPLTAGPTSRISGNGLNDSFGLGSATAGKQSPNLQRFMAALRSVESSGDYSAEGVPTPWGTASGAYQYLDGTWNNYRGYARAKDAPPEIQDEKAAEDMQRYYDEYGSWDDVSATWYSGPGGNWQSGEVREYVGKVNSRL